MHLGDYISNQQATYFRIPGWLRPGPVVKGRPIPPHTLVAFLIEYPAVTSCYAMAWLLLGQPPPFDQTAQTRRRRVSILFPEPSCVYSLTEVGRNHSSQYRWPVRRERGLGFSNGEGSTPGRKSPEPGTERFRRPPSGQSSPAENAVNTAWA